MGSDLIIRPATRDDAAALASRLRAADRDEAVALGFTPLAALLRSLALSDHAFAVEADGKGGGALICLWGVGPISLLGGIGCPWMMASDALSDHAADFLRHCPAALAFARSCYPVLSNHVDARNRAAVRWLRWMGFEIHPPRPLGSKGINFHRFTMGI